ncbi:AraC family transcriptional regulator [Biformimicrobium ophioploci]|uniref:AraC family transcriptional regulator n=1 Tax=Biformimicrobium ophioploci TaxID=3036711 RepID=A0ABQ6M1E3_9GAMM|nr:AraC family transcriptional regulator [Microbulbifer sp. NKW57]GMG88085.1 hypothetical protein MNKW57_24060 [Microbulbifer sp. NKW57]
MRTLIKLLSVFALVSASAITYANENNTGEQVEALKREVLKLNRDLLILEEDLLYPAQTQVSVYVSMDVGTFFELEGIKLHINNKLVASHLYTNHQLTALARGGMHPFFKGNLPRGKHEVTAYFTGKGPEGRDYKRAATLVVDKNDEPAVIELRIADSASKEQTHFSVVKWQTP